LKFQKFSKDILNVLIDENHARFEISFLKQISTFLPILNSEAYFPTLKTSSSIGSSIEISDDRIPIRYIELDENQMFTCEIMSIKNPNEFFIQPLSESCIEYLVLQEEMLAYYNEQSNKESKKFHANHKNLAVEYKSKFHRAFKISKENNEYSVMYFIDLGTYHKVHNSSIYRLDEQFYNLPAKVIKCSFYNVMSKQEKWSEESIKWFKTSVKNFKNLSVKCLEDDKIIQM
jgi:hypothetical protein